MALHDSNRATGHIPILQSASNKEVKTSQGIYSGCSVSHRHYLCGLFRRRSATAEARVRLLSGWCAIRCDDGVHTERVEIHADCIQLGSAPSLVHEMDTRGDFHTYRMVIKGEDVKVYVDGLLRLDGTGRYVKPAVNGRNDIGFGSANSPSTGEALWDCVRLARQAF